MKNIPKYLNELVNQKDTLADGLREKNVTVGDNETFNTLIPKALSLEITAKSGVNKKLYSFGVLSDIHVQDTSGGTLDYGESQFNYKKALNYYENNGMDFVGIAGDILALNRVESDPVEESEEIWIKEIKLYKEISGSYFSGDVHTCTGNHDVWAMGRNEPSSVNSKGMAYEITTNNPTYSEYKGKTCQEIWESEISPIHFDFEKNGDVFIFFSMYYWNLVNFCRSEDIDWLDSKLKQHKDKRVFLFFHLAMPETFDGPTGSYGLVYPEGPGGYSELFRDTIKGYSNVIWFSGHSHIELGVEDVYENPNVYQNDKSPTMIHCSTTAYVRRVNEDGNYTYHPEMSEGYTVDVYEKSIVVKGVDFTKGDGATISIAEYLISQ